MLLKPTVITSVHFPVLLDVAPGNAERSSGVPDPACFSSQLHILSSPLIEICLVGGLTEEPEHQLMKVGGNAHDRASESHEDAGADPGSSHGQRWSSFHHGTRLGGGGGFSWSGKPLSAASLGVTAATGPLTFFFFA